MGKTSIDLRGRCGNLVFYRTKTGTRFRSVPLKSNFPGTPAQRAARFRMMAVVRFYQRLKETPLLEAWRVAAVARGGGGNDGEPLYAVYQVEH